MKNTSDPIEDATIQLSCPRCGKSANAAVSETLHRGKPRWGYELHCEHCDARIAADSDGLAPEPFRTALLRTGGFALSISPPIDNLKGLKALREALGMSLIETRAAWQALLEGRTGTETEMCYLSEYLRAAGVAAKVRRAE